MAETLGARLGSGETLGDKVIKVDHAGEHGAINIYRMQRAISRWRAPGLLDELDQFLAHERRHRALFEAELARRERPRFASYHLCGLGGAVLGLITGLIGPTAIHATTQAIERVVLAHLTEQRRALADTDADAVRVIDAIISDEQAHLETAASHLGARRGLLEKAIDTLVAGATEAVIWLGMRL